MLPLCSAVSLTLPLGSATRQVRGAGATFWKALPGLVLGDTPRQKVLTSVLPWRGAGGRCQLFWACVLAADAGSFPWCPPGRGLRPSERKSEEGSRLWVGDWPGGPSEVPPGPRFSEKSPVPGSLIPLQAPPPHFFGRAVCPYFPPAGPGSVLSSLLEGARPFSVLHPFEYLKSASLLSSSLLLTSSCQSFWDRVWGLPPGPLPPGFKAPIALPGERKTGPWLRPARQSTGRLVGTWLAGVTTRSFFHPCAA